ncbi:MAG: rRNA adenine N-6-methyltransferase family protein, partial [Planctomycetota bacterium]
ANLPYQVASTLMGALLVRHPQCRGQFVTIQKEVADRLRARPSTKDYGALTVVVQALADVRRIANVAPSCFWPQPKVTRIPRR